MSTDDKKVIYSMMGVGKIVPPNNQILRDISLSYFYGAKIGVLGLNGSGKSNLLEAIAVMDREAPDWNVQHYAEFWEVDRFSSSISDYGTVEFKGRTLEVAFARTIVKLRNAPLGEYQEKCFITGFITNPLELHMAKP